MGFTIPWKTSPFSHPNLFLHKIQDIFEVQVIVVVPDSLLDVGVENFVHLGWRNPKCEKNLRKTAQHSRFFRGGILPRSKVISWDQIHHFGAVWIHSWHMQAGQGIFIHLIFSIPLDLIPF